MVFSLQCSSVNFCQHFFNLSHEACSPFNVGLKPADSLEGFGDEAIHVDHDGGVVHGGSLHSQLPLLQQSLVLWQKNISLSYFKKMSWIIYSCGRQQEYIISSWYTEDLSFSSLCLVCLAEIQTRTFLAASRRANNLDTRHPWSRNV
jgi:hypothetical protein